MTAPTVRARETTRPQLPTSVFAYSDALRLLRDTPGMTAEQLAQGTDRTPSNVRRDVHKLVDAGVIEPDGDGWRLTDKGVQWVQGMDVANGAAPVENPPAPGDVVQLPLDRLRPDPANPRRHFAPADLEALAQSIAREGLIQNLLVRPLSPLPFDDDAYPGEAHVIISGERRWRACRLIDQAGELPDDFTITCKIATPEDEAAALETALVENMQRSDLTHLEMAEAFEKLAEAARSNREIAEAVGKTPEFVQQHRRLMRLDPAARADLAAGRITFHEALKLLASPKASEPEPEQSALDVTTDQPTPTGPYVVDGVDYFNASRAQQARYDLGIDKLPQANSGGADPALRTYRIDPTLTQEEVDAAFDGVTQRAAHIRADDAAADGPTLSPRAQLALIELAHKVARFRLEPVTGETWSGDPVKDYDNFVASVGKYWLDKSANELVVARLAAFMMRPGGLPPIAVVTASGVQWLLDRHVPMPPSEGTLQNRQIMLHGVPVDHGRTYHTDWLETEVAPAADAPAQTDAPSPRDASNDDPWGRSPDAIAEDDEALARVRAWVAGDDSEARAAFSDLWKATGLAPDARYMCAADGVIELAGLEDMEASLPLATVDPDRQEPDALANARAMLIAWAINQALEGAAS